MLRRPSTWLVHFRHVAQFEPVTKSFHIRVRTLHQLKSIGDDPDWPSIGLSMLPSFEAEVEVSGVFSIDAESVDRSLWVGLGIGTQPIV
jgi:hypothetical protein